MTTTSASPYLAAKLLDLVLRSVTYTPPSNIYVALTTAAGAEASGNGYARKAASFEPGGATVERQAATTADLDWATMPAGTWARVRLLDAATGGNVLFDGEMDAAVTTAANDPFQIAAGDLVVRFLPGAMSDFLAHELLDHVLRSESYSPAASIRQALTDDAGVELSGGGYSRRSMTFGAAATTAGGASAANTAATSFTNLPGGTIGGTVLHEDANGGGNALFSGALSTPRAVAEGGRMDFAVDGVVPSID